VKLGGVLDLGLKQAQWTSIIFALILIPITVLVMRTRFAQPIPAGEIPATYGMPQKPAEDDENDAAKPKGARFAEELTQEANESEENAEKSVEEDEQSEETSTSEIAQEAES
jgi:phosphatidylglycerol---prolipoprotein diacylglyceryl transferase